MSRCRLCNVACYAIMRLVQDSEPLGLRERKLRETRHALESATVELALEHGLEHVTIEQIAERADVSPRTFFNHFGSKEDALIGVGVRESSEDLLAGFPDAPSSAGVYEDLKRFLVERIGAQLAADELLEKRMLVVHASPQLAKRQMAQLNLLLDGLTARVASLLALAAGLPADRPPSELAEEAQMLIHLCSTAFMHAFGPRNLGDSFGEGPGALAQVFELLERTAGKYLQASRP